MKMCPKCKLLSPPTAQRCDCGYDFDSGKLQESFVKPRAPSPVASDVAEKRKMNLYGGAILLAFCFAILFLIVLDGGKVEPNYGYGLMFWSGLYFYYYWKWSGRKGWRGMLVGVGVGLLAFAALSFVSGIVRHSTGG